MGRKVRNFAKGRRQSTVRRPYRALEHTADIRLRIFGKTYRQLLQNAVFAVTDTLTDAKKVKSLHSRRVRLVVADPDEMVLQLMREVLFLFDAKKFLTRRLVVQRLTDKILVGRLWGEGWKGQDLKTELKAVTYHGLKVEKKRERWIAEVILDV